LASAADPVVGALDALGATAVQQVAVVAHDTTSVPPTTPTDAPVPQAATQTVDAVPQVAGVGAATLHTTADSAAARTRPLGPPDDEAPNQPDEHTSRSPSHSDLPAVVEQTGRVIVGSTRVPVSGDRAALHVIQPPSTATASSHAARHLAGTLVHAVTSTPAAHELGEQTSRLTGALLGDVSVIAKTANAALATAPQSDPTAPLEPLTIFAISETPAEPIPAETARRSLQIGALASPAPGASNSASAPTAFVLLAPPAIAASTFARVGNAPDLRSSPVAGRSARSSLAISRRTVTASMTRGTHALRLPASAAPSTPAPGGISGASGAGAAGGLSTATSLALIALLLLLLVPPALRRLRLAGESLRAAQFALIPERPG
jgi:hypothetical protein